MNVVRSVIFCGWGVLLIGVILRADEPLKGPARFESEIQKFDSLDHANPPSPSGVLFYGSSSIRLWDLPTSFPGLQVVNRGFGGSDMEAAVHFFDRVVPQHKPRVIVLYEGDNDLAQKRTCCQVLAEFETLISKQKTALPEARLVCLSIKYSPSRAKLRLDQAAANALLMARCARDPQLVYVDVASTLLNAEGQPEEQYFQKDMLHLNLEGYARWNAKLLPVIERMGAVDSDKLEKP